MEHHQNIGTWRSFDATDGLPGAVNCIVVHPEGHLWLGTSGGLCHFDGVRFTTLTTEAGLSHDDISALLLDWQGRLWIGTRGGGVSCFDGGVFTTFGVRRGLAGEVVQCAYEDSSHRLWFGTTEGVSCYDGRRFRTYTLVDGLPNDSVLCICEDVDGRIWFGTGGGGATCFDGDHFSVYTTADGLGGNDVRAIFCDGDGHLWFGSDLGGAACLHGNRFTPLRVEDGLIGNRVRAIAQDSRGWLWFACWEAGLTCFDGDTVTSYTTRDGLLENRVRAMGEDFDGNLWFCHPLAGLSQFDPLSFTLLTDEPVSETLMCDRAGTVWFGNQNAICRCSGGEVVAYPSDSRVYQILQARDGGYWTATRWEGAIRYETEEDLAARRARRYTIKDGLGSDVVMALCEARDGTLWAGTSYPGTLCRFDGERFQAIPTPQSAVFRMIEDRAGRIWVGGFEGGGLSCFDGESLVTYTTRDGLPSDRIQSLIEDDAGRLWAGTQDGLCCFDGERFAVFDENVGIESLFHQVSAQDSRGHLWFGTLMGGLFRSDGRIFQWLTRDDGLPSNSITGLASLPDGGMLIGTYHGIVRYAPSLAAPPGITITELVADEAYNAPQRVQITESRARLVIVTFQAFSLATKRIRYVYLLEGYDDGWRHTWMESVRYEDLPTGRYRFRVRAYSRDLIPSTGEAVVEIEVIADPWQEQQAQYEAEIGRMAEELARRTKAERLNAVLVDLATSKSRGQGDVDAAFREITEATGRALAVRWTGIWLWDEQHQTLQCRDCFDSSTGHHDDGRPGLTAQALPRFLASLRGERIVACEDLATDPRTRELVSAQLTPEGAVSGMFAPVRVGGATAGAIHFVHSGGPRAWEVEESQFAASVADFVSLSLDEYHLKRAEQEQRLMEAQVQRAQKLESLAMMAGGVAHDFNNLLMAIIGNADLASATLPEAAKERRNLQQIQEAGMRAAELTEKMLVFAGYSEEPFAQVNLGELIVGMQETLADAVRPPMRLEIRMQEDMPLIDGNAAQLRQAVSSLVANAVEAVDADSGRIAIEAGTMDVDKDYFSKTYLSRKLLPGTYVYFEVSDNGVGMDARTQAKLFEPFYTTKFIGRGLGLPAVWGVVQGHKGAIRVESAPDQGARITVLFPPAAEARWS